MPALKGEGLGGKVGEHTNATTTTTPHYDDDPGWESGRLTSGGRPGRRQLAAGAAAKARPSAAARAYKLKREPISKALQKRRTCPDVFQLAPGVLAIRSHIPYAVLQPLHSRVSMTAFRALP